MNPKPLAMAPLRVHIPQNYPKNISTPNEEPEMSCYFGDDGVKCNLSQTAW